VHDTPAGYRENRLVTATTVHMHGTPAGYRENRLAIATTVGMHDMYTSWIQREQASNRNHSQHAWYQLDTGRTG